MKKVVTMLTLGGYNPMYHLSEKSIRRYAKRVGADFVKQTTPTIQINLIAAPENLRHAQQRFAWIQKFYMFNLLEKYDRVLYLDSDIMVTPHAPDIFELYPDEEAVYMLNESKHENKTHEVENIFSALTPIDWEIDSTINAFKYYNSGVILFSKKSKLNAYVNHLDLTKIFNVVDLLDQTYINYLIFKHQIPHHDLDEKFNWTSVFSDANTRFSAYFIHHTFTGFGKNRITTFRKDYYQLYQNDTLIEKMIETIRAKLFKLNFAKKYFIYRLNRLRPKHWRWIRKIMDKNK